MQLIQLESKTGNGLEWINKWREESLGWELITKGSLSFDKSKQNRLFKDDREILISMAMFMNLESRIKSSRGS